MSLVVSVVPLGGLFEPSGEVVRRSFITSGLGSCKQASGDDPASGRLLLIRSQFQTLHCVNLFQRNLQQARKNVGSVLIVVV